MPASPRRSLLSRLAPGLLVAATGVGAGDLLTAGYAGSQVGIVLVWAVVIGAVLKGTLNEGLARWQMATGTTLLEGWSWRLGGWIRWIFLPYFLLWSLMTGGALIKACGVAGDGLLPIGTNRELSQAVWGTAHSLAGLALVWIGGFRLFERFMSVLIASMFVCVVLSAALLRPDLGELASGLVRPPTDPADFPLALGLLGGVGGTVTLLSYGYWIQESGRSGGEGVRACRLDLSVAYAATALFGAAMLVISSRVTMGAKGADVALVLADELAVAVGPAGRWLFLLGFWGAVFSSLLGVWQSAPYLFADFLRLGRRDVPPEEVSKDLSRTPAYQGYLVAIALVPLVMLGVSVRRAQITYAVMGACFMPLVALTLLLLNNRTDWVGARFRNRWVSNALLGMTILLFAVIGVMQVRRSL